MTNGPTRKGQHPEILLPFQRQPSPYDGRAMFGRVKSVHFVGICGTAMASTAAALQEKGVKVTGSDQNVYPPMSTFLAERNIEVISGYAEQNLAHKPDLIVIGNAISGRYPYSEHALHSK